MNATRRLHDRALELAAAALDFGLPSAELAELDRHLATCPACARTAAAMLGDVALLRRPSTLLPSRRVDDAVHAAIAGRRDPRASSQRLLVLVAATALLLVALLGVAAAGAFILRNWPNQPVVVVDPSPSATPAPAWQIAPIPPMFAGRQSIPAAIAAGESGFAAVGARVFRDSDTPSGGTASAWHSSDGLSWEPVTEVAGLAVGDTIPMSGPRAGLVDVAWGAPGFVAVGTALQGEPTPVTGGAWYSSDGRTWTKAALPEPTLARPTAVTWNGSRYVAVGVVEAKDAPRAAAWYSSDGRSWSRSEESVALEFDIGAYIDTLEYHGWGGPTDVTSSADGVVYAVGQTCPATEDTGAQPVCQPLLWRSPDGVSWLLDYQGAPDIQGVLSSVAASGTRVVTSGSSPGDTAASSRVLICDGLGTATYSCRLTQPAGVPRLDRVVAFGQGFLAVSSVANEITLWASMDGEAWTKVPGLRQPEVLPDWEPGVQAFSDLDLVAAGNRVVIIGRNDAGTPEWGAFSMVGYPRMPAGPAESPVGSPRPAAQEAPPWRYARDALPVSSGAAQLAPGPDRGMYVLVSAAGDAAAGRPDRSVLGLLDPAGNPRAGWPVAVDGWYCDDPSGRPMPPETTSDGSVTVGCRSAEDAGGSVWTSVSRFDTTGRLVGSWSYRGEVAGRLRIVDDRLLLVTNELTERQVSGPGGALETRSLVVHGIQEVSEDGTVRSGVRVEMDDTDWYSAIGPDGTAYHVNRADGMITAFDMGGQRAGWPVQLGGRLSDLGFGADGRVLVGVATADQGATRLVSLGGDGSVEWRTDPLALTGASSRTGGGPFGPMAPLVADDGTAIVIGEAGGRAVIYAIDSAGKVKTGWPHRAATPPGWQGACAADVGRLRRLALRSCGRR